METHQQMMVRLMVEKNEEELLDTIKFKIHWWLNHYYDELFEIVDDIGEWEFESWLAAFEDIEPKLARPEFYLAEPEARIVYEYIYFVEHGK